jgi:hypothetical protein
VKAEKEEEEEEEEVEEEEVEVEEEEVEEEEAGDIAGHAATVAVLLPDASAVTQVQSDSCSLVCVCVCVCVRESRRTFLLRLAISMHM